jgi:hypothetical protein
MSQGKLNIGERQVQVADSLDDLNMLMEEWTKFYSSTKQRILMHDPKNILFELKRHKERYSPHCVIVWHHGDIECIAPFFLDTTDFRLMFSTLTLLSMRARLLRLFGGNFLFGERTVNFDCIDAVFHVIEMMRENFDILHLECVVTSSPLWGYCCNVERMKRLRLQSFSWSDGFDKIYRLKMPSSHEEWLKSLPRKRRQTFSWQTRKFEERVEGPVRLWSVRVEDDVRPFLDTLDTLFQTTWQAKTFGYWKRNNSGEIEYFANMARNGVLRSYFLMEGNRPVAFLVGFQFDGTYHYEEIGYDPNYAHLGPGGVLNSLVMKELYATETPSLIDFGFGENTYKKVLSNIEVDADRLSIVGTKKWLILMQAQWVLLLFYRWARKLIKESRAERWLKKFLKTRTFKHPKGT